MNLPTLSIDIGRELSGIDAPATQRSARNAQLDACRIAASIAIVWMHNWEFAHRTRLGEVGRIGVPFFTMAAMYLMMGSLLRRPQQRFIAYAKSRFLRLYVPFLAWTIIGSAGMVLAYTLVLHKPMAGVSISYFLTGWSFQLWYLPFLMLVSILFFPVCRWAAQLDMPGRYGMATALFIAGSALAVGPRLAIDSAGGGMLQNSYSLSLSWDAMPSVLCGIALALVIGEARLPKTVGWFGLATALAGGLMLMLWGRNIPLESAAGAGLLLFALSGDSGRISRALAGYAFLAYGIYLAQGVVLETLLSLAARTHLPATGDITLGLFGLTTALCVLISFGLARFRQTRWMLG